MSTAAAAPSRTNQVDHRPIANSWVVVFAGARDSYQVPLALHEHGLLKAFVTDFYAPLDKAAAEFACKLFPRKWRTKLGRRFHPELPSRLAHLDLRYAVSSARHPEQWPEYVGGLGARAGLLARGPGTGILAYSHVASGAFTKSPNALKVLFQMQPHPISVRRALAGDTLAPEFADHAFNELAWPTAMLETFSRESLLADFCIAASNYTRKTLIENGVAEDRIRVIPYGVDLDLFTPKREPQRWFTVLFVGQLVRQKGIHYLLEAWQRLGLPNSELRVVGRGHAVGDLVGKYQDGITFLGAMDWRSLRAEYRQADLVCLPSLSDGFGLVVLEAMACGTPVLLTQSCGAADLVREGENGFVVPAADLQSLMTKLEWAFTHRQDLHRMRAAARETATQYPWKRFRTQLAETL